MRTIALVTQKGGCGKSTLALSLAVAAHGPRCKTLILDTDPQHTVFDWWHDRETSTPDCVEIQDSQQISQAITAADRQGFDLVFIDTPGRDDPINARVISVADFCLIPCRPAMADMRAQRPTVDVVKRLEKGGGFVLMQTPARGPRFREAQRGLGVYGLPVAPTSIVYRQSYNDAYAAGMGVTEFEPGGKASEEIAALWQWVKTKIGKFR
jgi:chromosome partitioning protein